MRFLARRNKFSKTTPRDGRHTRLRRASVVLFGAEFTRVYAQARGRGIHPEKHAVRVDRKEIELPPLTDRGDK
jgi:hypothetical protein